MELADPGMRTPHAGPCLVPMANSRFYGIAAATDGSVPATELQLDAIARVCSAVSRHHHWVNPTIVGHDEQAIWTALYTTRRELWGKVGRKIDPVGRRTDGQKIIDIDDIRKRISTSHQSMEHTNADQ